MLLYVKATKYIRATKYVRAIKSIDLIATIRTKLLCVWILLYIWILNTMCYRLKASKFKIYELIEYEYYSRLYSVVKLLIKYVRSLIQIPLIL